MEKMDKNNFKEGSLVKEAYGSQVTLYDDDDNEYLFDLLLELIVNDKYYAYFQLTNQEDSDGEEIEIEVLRVNKNEDKKIELEFIDDEEWENACELFDLYTNKFAE